MLFVSACRRVSCYPKGTHWSSAGFTLVSPRALDSGVKTDGVKYAEKEKESN